METIYYAISTPTNLLLSFDYDERYGITYVRFCETNFFSISDGLFEKEEDATHELDGILGNTGDHDINEISGVNLSELKIVKIQLNFAYTIL